ncbi:hypothetical protein HYH03_002704 [Edaphochlamys debaryana]|uniref:Uncharacterized protein n=1 Tax=Edaphochlamys debaryana TaxID=47281 RepID=A0A836C3H9_9CHLO|nr:hypothetical protein HYH03_002704 [Edaphochlamys debaryana]|eukprot:KAG2499121.1 hypothetical protein HYH03_002704 [Edaphochlamys debaryana]
MPQQGFARCLRVLSRPRAYADAPLALLKLADSISKKIDKKHGIPNAVQSGLAAAGQPLGGADRPYAAGSSGGMVGYPTLNPALAKLLWRGGIHEICSPGQTARDMATQLALSEAQVAPVLWISVGHAGSASLLPQAPNLKVEHWPVSSAADSVAVLEHWLRSVRSQRYSLVFLDSVPGLAPPPAAAAPWQAHGPQAPPPPLPQARAAEVAPATAAAAGSGGPAAGVAKGGSGGSAQRGEPGAGGPTAAALGRRSALRGAPQARGTAALAGAATGALTRGLAPLWQPAVPRVARSAAEEVSGALAQPARASSSAPAVGVEGKAPAGAAALATGPATRAAEQAAACAGPAAAAVGPGPPEAYRPAVSGVPQPGLGCSGAATGGYAPNFKFLINVLPPLLESYLAQLAPSCGPGFRTTTFLINPYSRQQQPWTAGAGTNPPGTGAGGGGPGLGSAGAGRDRSRYARSAIARHANGTLHLWPDAGGAGSGAGPGALHAELTRGGSGGEDGEALFVGSLPLPVRLAPPRSPAPSGDVQGERSAEEGHDVPGSSPSGG